jgi:hypothetical protein
MKGRAMKKEAVLNNVDFQELSKLYYPKSQDNLRLFENSFLFPIIKLGEDGEEIRKR